ncbi:DUF1697 domain-containing protein [Microbacterium sp. gxy059]|uniref:DUF1697 domain-containing protein n=1 Tax=Microbacterium sp. gxy059 TaxID=2957199 RepID=UPI003D98A175
MTGSVALLRGINVGGKNLIRMPDLAAAFHDAGYADARTYIQSGNVVFSHDGPGGSALETRVEGVLEERLGLPLVVVTRSRDELAAIVDAAPASHGDPERRSDVIFLKHPVSAAEVHAEFPEPREGVDEIAVGDGVIYASRLAALASKSRISRITQLPSYRSMTIRNWRTTTRLLAMLDEG